MVKSLVGDGKRASPHADQVHEASDGGRHRGNNDRGERSNVGVQLEM